MYVMEFAFIFIVDIVIYLYDSINDIVLDVIKRIVNPNLPHIFFDIYILYILIEFLYIP